MSTSSVCGSALSDPTCLAGGGLSAEPSTQKLGRDMLLAGLCLQLAVMVCFIAFTLNLYFGRKYQLWRQASWRPCFCALFATMFLLLVRNVYRVREYATGYYSYLATHEVRPADTEAPFG